MYTENKKYEIVDAHIKYTLALKEYNKFKKEFPDQNHNKFYKKVEEAEKKFKRLVLEYRTRIYTVAGLRLPEAVEAREIITERKAEKIAYIRKIALVSLGCFLGMCLLFFVGRESFKAINAYFIDKGFTYILSGTVTNNHNNAEVIYMCYDDSASPFDNHLVVDSAKIVDDKFRFTGSTYYPARTFISIDKESVFYRSREKTAVLYIEPQVEVTCIINLDHPFDSIKVYNSSSDKDYRYSIEKIKAIDEYGNRLLHKKDSIVSIGDTVRIAKIIEELYQYNIEHTAKYLDILYSLDKNSSVVFDDYVSILANKDCFTTEQLSAIENNFMKVPEHIRDCNSGKRLSRIIEYSKLNFERNNNIK